MQFRHRICRLCTKIGNGFVYPSTISRRNSNINVNVLKRIRLVESISSNIFIGTLQYPNTIQLKVRLLFTKLSKTMHYPMVIFSKRLIAKIYSFNHWMSLFTSVVFILKS